jgi:hypothetical protein
LITQSLVPVPFPFARLNALQPSSQTFLHHGGPFQTRNTLDRSCYDSNGKPLEVSAGKLSESKKPYKKSGCDKGMAFMQSMFEAYAKKPEESW